MKHLRDHLRVKIQLESLFLLEGAEDWQQGILRNLSPSGGAMLVSDVLPTGAFLTCLRFVLPGEEAADEEIVEVEALVVGREHESRVGPRWNYLIRLKFLNMPSQTFARVQQFVSHRLSAEDPAVESEAKQRRRIRVEQPVVVKFDRLGDFEKMAACNLSQTGMFLAAENPKPHGSILDFEIQLGDDLALVRGRGEVVWTRKKGQGIDQPSGMGVRFFRMDETGREVIRRIVEEGGSQTPRSFNFERPADLPALDEASMAESQVEKTTEDSTVGLLRRIQQLESSLDEAQGARERLLERVGELNQHRKSLKQRMESLETSCRDLRLELHEARSRPARPQPLSSQPDWRDFDQRPADGSRKSGRSH